MGAAVAGIGAGVKEAGVFVEGVVDVAVGAVGCVVVVGNGVVVGEGAVVVAAVAASVDVAAASELGCKVVVVVAWAGMDSYADFAAVA